VADPVIERRASLDAESIAAVHALIDVITDTDQIAPLNEAAVIALHHDDVAHYLVSSVGKLVGYAQHDPSTDTAQVCVHPGARDRGFGSALVAAVTADHPTTSVWAFGNHRATQVIAARIGYRKVRELLVMDRPLTLDEARAPLPTGVSIRSFQPDDEGAVLAINAAAFAEHPEQGAMDHADFVERTEQPWYDAADLLVAVNREGTILGFHWTKRHSERLGEVYVIATAPDATGYGLGGALLTAGLAHLASTGCRRVILYVESDNAAVRLYRRHGFVVARSDIVYAPSERHLP
jgi:mycothiol synthase